MPNIDLNKKGKFVVIDKKFREFFKSDDNKTSYTNLTTKKNRLEKKDDLSDKEEELLNWINKKLDSETSKNLNPKRSRMNIGAEGTKKGVNGSNNFKNRRPNDSDNNNVGDIVKLTEEINKIKYLIKYYEKEN